MEQLESNRTPARQSRPLRWLRAGVVTAAALLVCIGGGWLLWRELGPADYRQVRAGMLMTEVVAVLGPPKDRGEVPGKNAFTSVRVDAPHGVIFVLLLSLRNRQRSRAGDR